MLQGMHFLNFPPAMQTVYNLMQVLTVFFLYFMVISDHMIVGGKYVNCNFDPIGLASSQSFQKEKMRKRNKIHTKVSIHIIH